MPPIRRIQVSRARPNGNPNLIEVEWRDRTWTVNQNTLNRFKDGDELKQALEKFLGQSVPDFWFHKNRDGSWVIATGPQPPDPWPEDVVETLEGGTK